MWFNSSTSGKWKPKRILIFLLGNALPVLLALYGLKCVVALHGQLTEPGHAVRGSFYLAPVNGRAAVMAGLGYILLALFGYLSCGLPPDEDRSLLWRVTRAVIRWGSLAATYFCWHAAHNLRLEVP